MHLAFPRLLTLPLLLSACTLPQVLGDNPGSDSSGPTSEPTGSTGIDPSGPASSSDASTTAASSAATSEATSEATTDGDPLCPGNPKHTCTTAIDCEQHECGALGSPFDADGCLRRSCDDAPCGPDEVCWADNSAGCAATVTACADSEGVCACTVDDACGGRYCYPAGDAPPAQCEEITDKDLCLASGCSSFDDASTLSRVDDECVCGDPLPACLWFPDGPAGDDAPAPFYNLSSLQVVVFHTAWDQPPHDWAPCVGAPDEPPACSCASIGFDPCA